MSLAAAWEDHADEWIQWARVPVLIGDAAALPVADESADLVLACTSLLDVDH